MHVTQTVTQECVQRRATANVMWESVRATTDEPLTAPA